MHNLCNIAALFDMRADFVEAHPYGSGHINDTYCAWYDMAGKRVRYIHQRINHHVFKDPIALMENIERVTEHSLQRLLAAGHPEARRRTLVCIPSMEGKSWARDTAGNYWRTYPFIERTHGYDEIESNEQAEQAAKAFAEFQKLVASLSGERLHETIPDFHHTPRRFEALEAAIASANTERLEAAAAEIEFALARSADCYVVRNLIDQGAIPERVTHNDTKLNNVLLDDVTSEGICVIDLDTTMPGSVLYDFGDMIRTICPTTCDGKVDLHMARLQSLLKGYLGSAYPILNQTEVDHLAFSGKLLTLECGIRFLTDFLQGDTYFKVDHPSHNLERCCRQFALLKAIEKRLPEMEDMVQTTAVRASSSAL